MSDDKKVSAFPARKPSAIDKSANQPDTAGGDQGSEIRPACGSCVSWRKTPVAGIGQGQCMFFPPNSQLIQDPRSGQPVGQIQWRTQRKASEEGCDQHDDGTEDDGGDEQPVPSRIAGVG